MKRMRSSSGVTRTRRRRARAAFTLIEAVLCSVLVSVSLVAALRAVAASNIVQYKTASAARGRVLASALMNEILQQQYAAPTSSSSGGSLLGGLVGVVLNGSSGGGGSPLPGNRLGFDDVDDYNGYSQSPPLNRDGTPIAGCTGFRRQVTVTKVNLSNLAQSSTTDTGAKLIAVTVTRNGLPLTRLVAVKTNVQ